MHPINLLSLRMVKEPQTPRQMMRKQYLLLFFLLFWSSVAFSVQKQGSPDVNDQLKILTIKDGLASNEVLCILQDSKGFIWYGTRNGLSRYDGYSFKTYKSNYLRPSYLTGNSVTCLAEDKNNRLWVGTTSGLNVLDMPTGTVKQYPCEIFGAGNILSVAVSKDNVPYIGTDKGLFAYREQEERFERIQEDRYGKRIAGSNIKALYADSRNYLWIGTWQSGFRVLDLQTETFLDYQDIPEQHSMNINSFYEDRDHRIWFSTWDKAGVFRISRPEFPQKARAEQFLPIKFQDKDRFPVVYSIIQDDASGDMWLATGNGLQVIRETGSSYQVDYYLHADSKKMHAEEVFCVYKDRTGILWISLYGSGVACIDRNKEKFNQVDFTDFFSGNRNNATAVTAIFKDENDMVWVGLKRNVLVLYDSRKNEFIRYYEHPVLKRISVMANSVMSIYYRPEREEIWLGTRYDGIYVVGLKNKQIDSIRKIPVENDFFDKATITSITEDQEGNILAGTIKGLLLFTPAGDGSYRLLNNQLTGFFYAQNIKSLLFDKNAFLWVGTQNAGLYRIGYKGLDTKATPENYSLKNGKLINNEVTCLFEDSKGNIWAGTQGGGLNRYNVHENRLNTIPKMNLIPDDAVYSMLEDRKGNLWLSTGNGLVCYNPDLPYDREIKIFPGSDELSIYSFYDNSSFRSAGGELFFGGNNGFVSFLPDRFPVNTFSPLPVITDIHLASVSLEYFLERRKNPPSALLPPFTDKIAVPFRENNLSISFSSLSFNSLDVQNYAYMLEGADKDWNYTGSGIRSVSYNNLPQGKYVFRVKSCNSDGFWSEGSTALQVTILPPFWNTPLAYGIYFVIASLLLFVILRFYLNRIKLKRMLAIKQIEKEKSEEVHQAKLRFFTNVSHELFTPMTILLCSVDDLIARYPQENRVLYIMKANINRLMRLLQQIMEFRKVETGNLRLKTSEVEVVSFIRELCDVNFVPLVEQKNITLDFCPEKESIRGYIDVDKLDKIMYNLLSNAFKYNKKDGHITVLLGESLLEDRRYLQVTVKDTGKGISKDVFNNLFKRFYEGDFRKFKVKGTGIGLSLTKDLVDLHKGTIEVETEEGVGTAFYLQFPLDREAYSPDQVEDGMAGQIMMETALIQTEEIPATPLPGGEAVHSVLLVEDHPELLKIMQESLQREFRVYTAGNGEEALKILDRKEVDLVVTDVVMPVMDGIRLCREMKQRIDLSHIPVVMLTAKHNLEDKLEGFEAGADVYVTKPFEMASLLANIRSLIRNRAGLAESFRHSDTKNELIPSVAHTEIDRKFLQDIIACIESKVLQKDFTTNDLYSAMNMSQPTMYRKLQSLIGMSPNELIRNIKIRVACRLLKEKGQNVSETAYDLGFNDPKYFAKIFKQEMGMTPSEYIAHKK